MNFNISKQSLAGLKKAFKEWTVKKIAEPIARKLGKSTAEIISTDGNIEIEGRFIAGNISITGVTDPDSIGEAVSENVEESIILTFVTRGDSRVCAYCETFKADHDTFDTADPDDEEILIQHNIMVELERQPMSLHEKCRCQLVRGTEKVSK